jgi:hypothetical protein
MRGYVEGRDIYEYLRYKCCKLVASFRDGVYQKQREYKDHQLLAAIQLLTLSMVPVLVYYAYKNPCLMNDERSIDPSSVGVLDSIYIGGICPNKMNMVPGLRGRGMP